MFREYYPDLPDEDIVLAGLEELLHQNRQHNIIKPVTLSWLAGFFEGEGCVSIHKNKRQGTHKSPRYQMGIYISNTEDKLLHPFSDRWGGNVRNKGILNSKKVIFQWSIHSLMAKKALLDMLPFFIGKTKRQAEIALEFQEHNKPAYRIRDEKGRIVPLSKEELQWREMKRQELASTR